MNNWHNRYLHTLKFGDRLSDKIASFIGSWRFLIIQTTIFIIWVIVNTLYLFKVFQFDPYPYILFNLFMSAEAAYSSPLIMMSQNRQAIRDRHQAEIDYQTNCEAKLEVEDLQRNLARIELEKLDYILAEHQRLHEKLDDKLDHVVKCLSQRTK